MRQRGYVRGRAMADTCQTKLRRKDWMTSLDRLGRNKLIEERRIKTRLSKETFKEWSLSK